MKLKHIIIFQNKVDLVQESVAINQHDKIQKFILGTVAEGAPVIPVSARAVPTFLEALSKLQRRGLFELGVLKGNQDSEVRPGIVVKDRSGNIKCTPIYSRIVSLYAEQNELQFAVPGGLIGVGTTMDPMLTVVIGWWVKFLVKSGLFRRFMLNLRFTLMRWLLGVKTEGTEKRGEVSKLLQAEILMLNIGSMSMGARVLEVKKGVTKLQLSSPVCTNIGEKIALSRRVERHWRLIGWGTIQAGLSLEIALRSI
ncbi:putative protein-synthesizing GTPase [Helianthus anomalus]